MVFNKKCTTRENLYQKLGRGSRSLGQVRRVFVTIGKVGMEAEIKQLMLKERDFKFKQEVLILRRYEQFFIKQRISLAQNLLGATAGSWLRTTRF